MRSGKRDAAEIMIPNQMPPEHRQALRKAGVVFGKLDKENSVFVRVTLPRGWRYTAPHSMHKTSGGGASIFDRKGRERAITHCCVGPEEQYMTLVLRRYGTYSDYYAEDGTTAFKVLDTTKKKRVKFTTRRHSDPEKARKEITAWLNRRYPKWEDVSAYWR